MSAVNEPVGIHDAALVSGRRATARPVANGASILPEAVVKGDAPCVTLDGAPRDPMRSRPRRCLALASTRALGPTEPRPPGALGGHNKPA